MMAYNHKIILSDDTKRTLNCAADVISVEEIHKSYCKSLDVNDKSKVTRQGGAACSRRLLSEPIQNSCSRLGLTGGEGLSEGVNLRIYGIQDTQERAGV